MLSNTKLLFTAAIIGHFAIANSANAQSIGSFATRPIAAPPSNAIELPHKASLEHNPPIIVLDDKRSNDKKPSASVPAPVVMFRQVSFPAITQETLASANQNHLEAVLPTVTPVSTAPTGALLPLPAPKIDENTLAMPPQSLAPNEIMTPAQAETKRRRRFWEPLELPATPAPSILEPAKGLYRDITMDVDAPIDSRRGPMKAIVQDSSRALRRDVPQALADALPWVDNARKQEPFDSVLARVTDNLSRANASDPEWANPAQSEIRELATRLDRLSSPPQYRAEYQAPIISNNSSNILTARPFYTRPIWPGARANSESQLRPVAILSNSQDEVGVNAAGQNLMVAPEPSEEQKPKPAQAPNRRRR